MGPDVDPTSLPPVKTCSSKGEVTVSPPNRGPATAGAALSAGDASGFGAATGALAATGAPAPTNPVGPTAAFAVPGVCADATAGAGAAGCVTPACGARTS